ncbi:hypothetical protein EV702DRAFT_1283630 [Suillus placidus]|uniref:Uncharacterized protein n=1 Tax=Suillus placidus TaxID=48579 RepID=A0A9P7CVR9_9AGAM|nr:hypothetical protein EV702DRAFT_1283630 [Suillus placidus]
MSTSSLHTKLTRLLVASWTASRTRSKFQGCMSLPWKSKKTLLAHPDKLIIDVSVAGVSGGRTWDERIPRAWVVLSHAGASLGEKEVVAQLDAWVQERLSRYKWLGGHRYCGEYSKVTDWESVEAGAVEQFDREAKAKL